MALCEIEAHATVTAGLCLVDGESWRVEGGHRGKLAASVTRVVGRMSLSWFRVVVRHTYVVLLADVSPILTGPAHFRRTAKLQYIEARNHA